MLNQMQNRFKGMSENIVERIDEMGTRIEELEKSIGELVNEASAIDEQNPGAPVLAKAAGGGDQQWDMWSMK